MPLISNIDYRPPWWLINGHWETIYPAVFRKVVLKIKPNTRNIELPDGDAVELDYYDNSSARTVIISHGLEGNSRKPYVLGMVRMFFSYGWNVVAWNYRGCNGRPNISIKSYHSGFTEDLREVIGFADKPAIKSIALIGFSLGGNLTLRYLGENTSLVNNKICCAAVFSVPIDLHQSCLKISERPNFLYAYRFLKSLKAKIREKSSLFPEIEVGGLDKIRDLKTFDDRYTAPMHGFRDALDYYQKCSAMYVLDNIHIPTVLINAINDPFLTESCFPVAIAQEHKYIHLAMPQRGGHVGFALRNLKNNYWSEIQALEFVERTV